MKAVVNPKKFKTKKCLHHNLKFYDLDTGKRIPCRLNEIDFHSYLAYVQFYGDEKPIIMRKVMINNPKWLKAILDANKGKI